MSRELPPWTGRTDGTPIPPRVKDRILRKSEDCCKRCGRAFMGKLRPEFHHVIPLILGGANCESNLEPICSECHKAQTKLDVKVKSKIAAVRAKHLNLRSPRHKIQSRGFAKAPPQHSATRPIERRS